MSSSYTQTEFVCPEAWSVGEGEHSASSPMAKCTVKNTCQYQYLVSSELVSAFSTGRQANSVLLQEAVARKDGASPESFLEVVIDVRCLPSCVRLAALDDWIAFR